MLTQQATVEQVNVAVDNPEAYYNFLVRGSSGMGTHLAQHLVQSYRTGLVSYFDYGPQGNLQEYGSETPPLIHYENHEMPVAMYYSPDDGAADLEDAEWARDQLGDQVVAFNLYPGYSHVTFGIGNDMTFLDDLFEIMEEFPIPRESL